MPDINQVSVTFENGIKREEYGPTRKAAVTITATVADGEDGGLVLDLISTTALAKVAFLLAAPKPQTAANAETADKLEAALTAPAGEAPARRTRKPAPAPADAPSAEPAPVSQDPEPQPETDPASAEDEWAAGKPAVTDAELLAATSQRAQAGGNDPGFRQKIKDLIGQYDPQKGQGTGAFKVQDIAAELRQDYLDKLAALA